MERQSQNKQVLNHLRNKGPLDPLTALRLYGIFRLGARCWDLKKSGESIVTTLVTKNGKRYAEYSLEKSNGT